MERRGRLTRNVHVVQPAFCREETKLNKPRPTDKSFAIPKPMVWEAWRQVKANKGAPGVDGQLLEAFDADLRNNLYRIWNRMSSGTCFPPPVKAVEIPKPHGGGVRVSGVPRDELFSELVRAHGLRPQALARTIAAIAACDRAVAFPHSARVSMAIEFSPTAATNFPTGGHFFSPLVATNLPTDRDRGSGLRPGA